MGLSLGVGLKSDQTDLVGYFHNFCANIAQTYFLAGCIVGQRSYCLVSFHVYISVTCRVPSLNKETRTYRLGSYVDINSTFSCSVSFCGCYSQQLSSISVCKEKSFASIVDLVVWGFPRDSLATHSIECNRVSFLEASSGHKSWLVETSLSPITRSPH